MTMRTIIETIEAQETSDGAGVRLKRSIGSHRLDNLDPFLLLDEFGSDNSTDYIAGFPDHPHRGFETVTLMLDGIMRHEDSAGNGGSLLPGGVQWMTAGRGIVHSEMPETREGLMRGFQLWVNLPAKDKMAEPRYQNIEPDDVPEIHTDDGATVRVIAGVVNGVDGAVTDIAVQPTYLDITLAPNGRFSLPLPEGHQGFVYLYEGSASVEDVALKKSNLGVLSKGDGLEVQGGENGARLILVAGAPLNEPIARHGPFVMNTREEIQQAFDDFRAGRF